MIIVIILGFFMIFFCVQIFLLIFVTSFVCDLEL